MNFLKKTSLLVSVFLATQLVCSQEAIPVSGVEATASGDSANDTVGQVFYTTHSDTTVAISQGVQHLFELQMKYLATGASVLKVSQKNKSLKTFKINKH